MHWQPANRIRLVTFDALFTLVKPRKPIHEQYSDAFEPFLGRLDAARIKRSFKQGTVSLWQSKLASHCFVALCEEQDTSPAYNQGHEKWWSNVIRKTALGAGAEVQAVNASLPTLVPRLLNRFSSDEGYELYSDAMSTGE